MLVNDDDDHAFGLTKGSVIFLGVVITLLVILTIVIIIGLVMRKRTATGADEGTDESHSEVSDSN